MAEKTASFTIPIEAESNAPETAADLEDLRRKIFASQEAVKDFAASMRALRGASDEVKGAKADLKAKIDAERDALSRANLALVKQGSSYEKLARQERASAKELAEQKKRLDATHKAVSVLGGPVAELRERFDSLKTVLGGATGASGAFTVAMAATTAGVVAAVVAVAAGVAGVVGLTLAFGKFVVEGANAIRTMGIMREAASGSAANASALGHQIDALALKIPTAKAELNELALDMTRSFMGTRVSGEGLIDTFNAVAQVSEAMGKQAGSQIQSIIDRSKQWGRMGLGLFELQGTGISFEDVAQNLSKSLKIGLNDARLQLRMGWVDVNAGAEAIRKAAETKFARLNLAKMLDFDVIRRKLGEFLQFLTGGVNLEPLLKAFQDVASLFSTTTVAGSAMKDIVTDLGNALVGGAAGGANLVTKAIKQLIIWAYEADIAFLKWKKGVHDVEGSFKGLITGKDLLFAMKAAIVAVGVSLAAAAVLVGTFVGAFKAVEGLVDTFNEVDAWITGIGEKMRAGFASVGSAIIGGIAEGIRSGWNALKSGVVSVAEGVKNTFKSLLGIHSPSVVFADYGKQSMRGYAQGAEDEAPRAQSAVAAVVPSPAERASAGAPAAPSHGPVSVKVEVIVEGGAHPHETARALSEPDFLARLTKAVEEGLASAGIPTQQAAAG